MGKNDRLIATQHPRCVRACVRACGHASIASVRQKQVRRAEIGRALCVGPQEGERAKRMDGWMDGWLAGWMIGGGGDQSRHRDDDSSSYGRRRPVPFWV